MHLQSCCFHLLIYTYYFLDDFVAVAVTVAVAKAL